MLLKLPELAPGMDTATLATWLKKEGDLVAAGEAVAEIETDKTSVELEAPSAGVIAVVHVPAGTTIAIGTVLAEIREADVAISTAHPPTGNTTATAAPGAGATAADSVAGPDTAAEHGTGNDESRLERGGHVTASDRLAAPAAHAHGAAKVEPRAQPSRTAAGPAGPGPDRVTPLAARMAELAGIDLSTLTPAAADGRIRKGDIDAWLAAEGRGPAAVKVAPVPAPSPRLDRSAFTGAFEARPLSAMRRTTAARLQHAKQTIPHFYLEAVVSADALVAARERTNATRGDAKLTVTDFLVCATAQALREVPLANATWADDAIRVYESVDIAVAVTTPKGLVTPVIRRCHEKSLGALSRELKALAAKAREGALGPAEYSGGSFTISNLGMYGITSITPIVNPPQCAILGVGAIEMRPVVVDGALAIGRVMQCTLAADHRVIDGATGAELLSAIKRWLEDPMAMALRL